MPSPPPRSIDELLGRAQKLAGQSIGILAPQCGFQVPEDLRRHKGFIGHVLEHALGASAGSRAEPDFPGLGIEMKSLPIHPDGRVKEATYVCTAPLDSSMARNWEESWPARKLSQVLWIPIIQAPIVGDRVIATPLLWRPSREESETLAADYREITDLIALGELRQLTSKVGTALHLRPKGANADDLTWAIDDGGTWSTTVHRGFYLRPTFTHAILRAHYHL